MGTAVVRSKSAYMVLWLCTVLPLSLACIGVYSAMEDSKVLVALSPIHTGDHMPLQHLLPYQVAHSAPTDTVNVMGKK